MQNRTFSSLLVAAALITAPCLSSATEYNIVHPYQITNGVTSMNIIPQYVDCFKENGDKLIVYFRPGADTVIGAKFAVENRYSIITGVTGRDNISSDELQSIMSNTLYKKVPFLYFRNAVIQSNHKVRDDVTFISVTYERGLTAVFAKEFAKQQNFKNIEYIYIPTVTERITYIISNLIDYAIVTESETLYQQAASGRFKILEPKYEGIMWLLTTDKELESKINKCSAKIKYPYGTGFPDQVMIQKWNKRFSLPG